MSYAALYAQRRFCGQVGCVLMLLILAALFDGVIAGGLKDPNRLDALAGQTVSLSEQLPRGAKDMHDIEPRPSDARISVKVKEQYSGFWMGGSIWRAEAELAPDLPVGVHRVAMFYHNGTDAGERQAFTISVHPDAGAIRAASSSLTMRTLGISPYVLVLCLLGLALLPMAASFVLTRKIAQALRAAGMAEIFRAMAPPKDSPLDDAPEDDRDADDGQRIFFSPGPVHGLKAGMLVDVLDERAHSVLGQAKIVDSVDNNVVASMQNGVQVRPGSLIRRPAAT